MKKIIFSLLFLVPLTAMAQSEWELPQDRQQSTTDKIKELKQQLKAEKAAQKAQKKAMKESGIKPEKAVAEKTQEPVAVKYESKYGPGSVTEVDGKVEWAKDFKVSGVSADNLYDKILEIITEQTKAELAQSGNSFIAAVNKKEKVVAAHLEEKIVFQHTSLALDQAICRYSLIATCTNGNVNVRICRISYDYNNAGKKETIVAEERITDSAALNKKKTAFYRGYGKFRERTIDRKDEVFKNIAEKLGVK